MNIDLNLLNNGDLLEIDISGTYKLDKSYYENSDIIFLDDILVKGMVVRRENDDLDLEYYIKCEISGCMQIEDSISLELIEYPFNIKYDDFIDENCIKNENLLDIFTFLWDNIVLEVPLHFTKVSDLSKFHGDGWKLVSEEYKNNEDNPFSDLLKDFEKE